MNATERHAHHHALIAKRNAKAQAAIRAMMPNRRVFIRESFNTLKDHLRSEHGMRGRLGHRETYADLVTMHAKKHLDAGTPAGVR